MNTQKRLTVRKLLSGALALLGFASCSEEFGGEILCEYGTPYGKYIVKGTVTSDADKPLKGIQVIVRQSWNNNILPSDTVYTDEKGAFNTGELGMGGIGMQKVYFNDIDGDENEGAFKSDSLALKDMTVKQLEKAERWYIGKFEYSSEKPIKLSKEEKKKDE